LTAVSTGVRVAGRMFAMWMLWVFGLQAIMATLGTIFVLVSMVMGWSLGEEGAGSMLLLCAGYAVFSGLFAFAALQHIRKPVPERPIGAGWKVSRTLAIVFITGVVLAVTVIAVRTVWG
jgi:hypothetical protein